jgi:hypothetical protein
MKRSEALFPRVAAGSHVFSSFLTERDRQLLSAQPAPIHIGLDSYAFWARSWLRGYCACVLDLGRGLQIVEKKEGRGWSTGMGI